MREDGSNDDLTGFEPVEPMPADLVLAQFLLAVVRNESATSIRLAALRGYKDLTGFRGELYPEDEEAEAEAEAA